MKVRGAAVVLVLGACACGSASALVAACSLPGQVVPPYDAAADGGTGVDAGSDAAPQADAHADAGGDSTVQGDGGTGVDSTTGVDASDAGADATSSDASGDSVPPPPDAPGPPETGTTDGPASDGPPTDAGAGEGAADAQAYVGYVVSDVTGDAGVVTVISVSPLAVLASIPVGNDPWSIAFTPDGSKAYVTEAADGTVTVIDTASRQVVKTVSVVTPAGVSLRGVTVSRDGQYAFVSDDVQSDVVSIDTSTDTLTATALPVSPFGAYGLAFTPDGSQLWAGGAGSNGFARFAYPALTSLGATAGGPGSHMLGDRIVFNDDDSAAFLQSGSGCQCCGELDQVVLGGDGGTNWVNNWAGAGYGLVMGPGGGPLYTTNEATPIPCSAAQLEGALSSVANKAGLYVENNSTLTYDEPRGLAITPDGKTLLVAGYRTGGGSPGVIAYEASTLNQIGTPLAMPGLPKDVAVQP